MQQKIEEAIRERAYHLWIESGCSHGQADAHWLAARREILGSPMSKIAANTEAPTIAAKPKKTKIPAKKRRAS